MADENQDHDLMRRYLLGQLAEDERQHFEETMMADNDLYNRALLAEDEMVEEYLQGELSEIERAGFEASFLSTAEGRKQVSFAKALSEYVSIASASEGGAADSAPEEPARVEPAGVTEQAVRVTERPARVRNEPARASKVSRPVWWSRPALVPHFRLAAAAVIVIGLGLGISRVFFYQSDVNKGLAALNNAYRQQRPVEPRITGFEYAPTSVSRGGPQKVDTVSLNRAERILFDEAAEHPNAKSHHALARLYLAEQKFDDAIREFDEALKTEPNNAQLHSDYGAALLENGKADLSSVEPGKSLEEFATSLEHLTKALDLDASLLEARFNRALLYQYMRLPRQAAADWHRYLEKDSSSMWAEEARLNLNQLEQQKDGTSKSNSDVLRDYLDAYRSGDDERAWRIAAENKEALSGRLVSAQLLGSFLELSQKDRTAEASEMLRAAAHLGELENQRAYDKFTSGEAGFYASLTRKQISQLAEAQKLMQSGKGYYAQARNDQAITDYSKARTLFEEAGNKWGVASADYWIAYSYPDKADMHEGRAKFERLETLCQKSDYKWLLMRTLLGLSVVHFDLKNNSRAIDYANQALKLAEQMNDSNGEFNGRSYLIEYYRSLGNHRQSLAAVQRSFPLINAASLGRLQLWRHYAIVASAFESAGFRAAAIDYQREALELARSTNNPATLSVSYSHLAMMLGNGGNYSEAIANLQAAHQAARSCSDEGVRQSQTAYAALQLGNLYRRSGELARAIENYSDSIEIYKTLKFPTFLYQAHKGKFISYVEQLNDSLAGEELEKTLELAETYRSTVLEGENRNSFFDQEQSVYDVAIGFEYVRRKNAQEAFKYSEASRARSLLDLLSTNTAVVEKGGTTDIRFQDVSRPLPLASLQQRLPENAQILQYAVLRDRLLIWIITRSGFSTSEQAIDEQNLNDKVQRFLEAVSRDSDPESLSDRAKELTEILLASAEPFLDKSKLLCIVPDKVLNYLPFAALVSGNSTRHLIEDYSIVYAPSSSVFVLCSEKASEKEAGQTERILCIGNPSFDRNAFPSLPDIPSAGAEARRVAAYYPSSRCLVGKEAREDAVTSEIPKSDVVHFALHSVVDEESPMKSRLVLAKETPRAGGNHQSEGVLESCEVYKLKLPRTRLVVLSACQTGVDRYYRGEGMISIARPFIAAGVPLTIASLWPVDSDATAELMTRFHKHRKQDGMPTLEALRRAQEEMMNRPEAGQRSHNSWASFIAIGGNTRF